MNESLVKYLAGLMDADGSLSFSFRCDQNKPDRWYVGLQLQLASSDVVDRHGFVDELPKLTGMGSIGRYGDRNQYKTWIIAKRSHVEMIVPRLLKHMIIKAKHWQWLFDTWRIRRSLGYGHIGISLEDRNSLREASKESRKANVGPLHAKNYPTWAWLAGYLDGDGWYRFQFVKNRNVRVVSVGAVAHKNDASVLEFLERSYGGVIRDHGQSENVFVWHRNLGVKDASFAMRFLTKLARHSRLKKHKIDQMIHYHRQRLSALGSAEQATV